MAYQTDQTTCRDPELQVLMHAISSCSGIAVQQLLKQKPSLVNLSAWHGQTPLHRACLSGDVAMLKLLLENGADPNAVNDFNETPVHYASKRGIPTLVHALVKAGGNLNVKDKRGQTLAHNAAQTGSVYMLQYLEENGFNFHDVDDNLQTALHRVCAFGHLEAFKYLMRKGRSDPFLQDINGDTPLHICVREGYSHGSWILLTYQGLSALHVKNKSGQSPADVIKNFETSKKEGHVLLRPLLAKLSQQPQNSKIKGPSHVWYMNLLLPLLVYAVSIPLALNVFPNYQGIVFGLSLGYIIRHITLSSHRLIHVCRWDNPVYAGMFAGGIFHTILVYFWKIAYNLPYPMLFYLSVVFTIVELYQYYMLLKIDPGLVKTGEINATTRKPLTLTDLCEKNLPVEMYCFECEFVRAKQTKHCKLCDKCIYKMDHHCLFLMKCVGHNNHTRFVWFLILTAFVMTMFVVQAFLTVRSLHPDQPISNMLLDMFWYDGWVLSMVLQNIASVAWAVSLIRFQLTVVGRAQTTYFQQKIVTLTQIEQLMNIINFLQGKQAYAKDYEFDESKMKKPYPVQAPSPPLIHNV